MAGARDPWVTASTLVAFLCLYNIVLALTQVVASLLSGAAIRPIERVWDYRACDFRSIPGFVPLMVQLVTAAISVPIQVLVVQRAKLVLDFSTTIQFSHLLFTFLYSGALPNTWQWWGMWLVCTAVMVFGGEMACMGMELRPILFGSNAQGAHAETGETNKGRYRLARHDETDEMEMQERHASMEEGRAGAP